MSRSTTSFEPFVNALAAALTQRLPGLEAQLAMAPSYRRHDPQIMSVEGKACREGGVLVLLYPRDGMLHLLLTVRSDALRHHSGQVSFPGGRCEPHESPRAAALREAQEECGLDPSRVRLLGTLTPLYIPPSNFCIYPQVAFAPQPQDFQPDDAEVAALLEVPLELLTSRQSRREELWELRGERVPVPFYEIAGHKVWGATAMVLSELVALLEQFEEVA